MPMDLLVGDIIRVRVASYTPNQVGMNVVHFQVTAKAGAGKTDFQVADALDSALADRYAAAMSVGARYRGLSVQKIAPFPVALPQVAVGRDRPGTVAGDMMAPQVTGLISSQTNFAGRKYRGRVYIPFPGEDSNAATGVPTAVMLTALDFIALRLFAPLVVGLAPDTLTITPVVWDRAGLVGTPIVNHIVRTGWATQRRRSAFGQQNVPPF